jgi:NAD(P)H-quinone oxidoreductase subunit 5
LYFNFNTLQIEELFRIATGAISSKQTSALNLACLGFVLAAFCKSAQLPFHSWLPDTLECPTPVSALMHAGIINGGGYLLIRLSPLFVNAATALNLLVFVGTLTAVFGVAVMWAQTTVKKSLAWSTVAQMGFMMVECGVGAYSIAIAHILGHGFYKANSFLLSGTSKKFVLPNLEIRSAGSVFSWLTIGLIFSTFALAGGLCLVGGKIATYPGGWVMAFVLCLALSQLFTIKSSSAYLGLLNRLCLTFIVTALALGLELIFQATFAISIGVVPSIFERGGMGVAVGVFACLSFLFLVIFSVILPNVRNNEITARWRAHAINGFYLGIYADRLTARLFQKTV